MKNKNERTCICLDCIYGSQPYGYFPIVCVYGNRSRDMYYERYKCNHFEKCPELPESEAVSQEPWKVIITNEKDYER